MKFDIGNDILNHEYKGAIYNKTSAVRLKFIYYCLMAAFALFILRTLQLGLQNNDFVKNKKQNSATIESRADIVDRNGVILAKSIKSGHIKLYPPRVKDKDVDDVAVVINKIAPNDFSVDDAMKLIKSGKSGVYIKKKASEEQIKYIKEKNKTYDCFDVEEFTVRNYPQKNVFAHVVGYAGKDAGLAGVEYMYDSYLRENNDPLVLSIDSRIQNIFHEQLTIAMEKYRAKGAMGMLMKSSTGEILSMVQLPDYNPNAPKTITNAVSRFRIMRDNFEMGSVFKIFNTALAYENGLQNKDYKVDEPLMIYDKFGRPALPKPIDDVRSFKRDVVGKMGKHTLKAPEIMLYSCNVGSARLALDLPEGAQKEFFARLNLDRPLQLEFGKTETAISYKHWGQAERATASFGHGVTITPMHLLLGVNAMTNGGFYIFPTLLKRGIGEVRGERVLDSKISEKLREIMFRIAEETTAKRARVQGIKVGGKTGTAEKRDKNGRIDSSRNFTVFAGVFPVDAPQYVIIVMLDEPNGTEESQWRTAAWNSVPTAGAILDGIMPLLFE